MAATSCHGMLQDVSAALITCAERWYAERAAVGMPLVEELLTICLAEPAPLRRFGMERLAGASIAWVGIAEPSGSVPEPWLPAAVELDAASASEESPEEGAARLAVHAPERIARGTRVVAFCHRVSVFLAIVRSAPLVMCRGQDASPPKRRPCPQPLLRAPGYGAARCEGGHAPNERSEECPTNRHVLSRAGFARFGTARAAIGGVGDDGGAMSSSSPASGPASTPPSGSPSTTASQALFDRAHAVTPGGVNSPVRAFHAVGGTPRFIASARGPYLTDVDGTEYVDLICSWGPMLLGHAHPEVVEAVTAAAARGSSYGTPTLPEVELAEEIVGRTSVEQVRFVSSGTEATMSAVRLARGVTGRDTVVKFSGCYHGHVDSLLAAAGSGLATFAVPGTPGVPAASTADTLVLPYNDRAAVEQAFADHGDQIACLVTEAMPGNMGVVPPEPGFNAFLSEIAGRHGALFVSDEVMTGFRLSRAGMWGLDGKVEGWSPDLVTFGKVMGGGFPAAAFGGRADLMSHLSPEGAVYQAGTLSGNPVATTAGLTTLRLATDAVYAHVDAAALTLQQAAGDALRAAGVPHLVQAGGSMFSVFFTPEGTGAVTDFAGASTQEVHRYRAFFHSMLDQGVHLPPSAYEAWFVSAAHDDAALDRVVAALPAAARAAAAARPEESPS